MEPEIVEAVFQDADGKEIIKASEDITIVSYKNNIEFGKGDVEIKIKGYLGTLLLEDVFEIRPAQVADLETVQVSEEAVELTWSEIAGAEGYHIFRSENNGEEYTLIFQIEDGKTTTYQDTDIEYNKIYQYKVCAYATAKEEVVAEDAQTGAALTDSTKSEETILETGEMVLGDDSNIITCYTPLETPVLKEVKGRTYNSILVQWQEVDGADGYQVCRSNKADGEYSILAEFSEGTIVSYTDETCECGVEYFYYVKAAQNLESETVYGKSSNVSSAKTVPNEVKLSGTTAGSATEVTLNWKQSDGAQGYEIYRRVGDSDYKLVKKIEKASVLSWTESGLTKEKEYTYKIRPYCVVNGTTVTGSYSNTYTKKAVVEAKNTNTAGNSGNSSNSGSSSNSGTTSAAGSLAGITKYVGVSYVSGGNTPSGWDCSGFTQWALKNYYGVSIPRTAAAQGSGGTAISKSNRSAWQPGDILAYSNGSGISHVALYLGNGQIMHALNSKYDTIVQGVDYYESWDAGNYLVAVRRYH